MARYIAGVQGNRGSANRLGSAKSGIRAVVNGWNIGVRVYGNPADKDGKDVFAVYATGGSNGKCADVLIATVRADEKGIWWNVNLPHMSDLLAACRALQPLLDADLEALTPWKKEIEALTKLL